MIPWILLGTARVPGERSELRLFRRGGEFAIRVDGNELMNSRMHGSEDELAELACARIAGRRAARVLIGGLGMGFTLAAALRKLGPDARLVVAELVPDVVQWNRGPLAELAGRPLEDGRVIVREEDVVALLRAERGFFDAILLDVDNGPAGLSRKANDWLYGGAGLKAMRAVLREGGVLALWSAGPDRDFVRRLGYAGFDTEEIRTRARGGAAGSHHVIWLATRRARAPQTE